MSIEKSYMQYDIVVLGATTHGYIAAIRAALKGYSVICIADEIGGYNINYGAFQIQFLQKILHNPDFILRDINLNAKSKKSIYDFAKILAKKRYCIREIKANILYLFQKHNIFWLKGRGEFISNKQILFISMSDQSTQYVDQADTKLEDSTMIINAQKAVIIATDPAVESHIYRTRPCALTDPNTFLSSAEIAWTANNVYLHEYCFYTPMECVFWTSCPASVLLLGSDMATLELACLWNALGSYVQVVNPTSSFDTAFDHDMMESFLQHMYAIGISISFNMDVEKFIHNPIAQLYYIHFNNGSTGEYTKVISCIRSYRKEHPQLTYIHNQSIYADIHYRTNLPDVYVIGANLGPNHSSSVLSDQAKYVIDYISHDNEIFDTVVNHTDEYAESHIYALSFQNKLCINMMYTLPQIANLGSHDKDTYSICRQVFKNNSTYGVLKIYYNLQTEEIFGMSIMSTEANKIACQACTAMTYHATLSDSSIIADLSYRNKREFVEKLLLKRM